MVTTAHAHIEYEWRACSAVLQFLDHFGVALATDHGAWVLLADGEEWTRQDTLYALADWCRAHRAAPTLAMKARATSKRDSRSDLSRRN